MDLDYLVAIPVFNEAKYLVSVLQKVRRFSDRILVIDDGSTDATPELLRSVRGIEVITHAENHGYGKSLADAFSYAIDSGVDWLLTLDCDEQHEPSCIPRFLEEAALDRADIISGTRYPKGHQNDQSAPADRRVINAEMTEMLNRSLGLDITDAFCGFKAYRVAALSRFRITVSGYAMPMQFWVQAARADLSIAELPVRLIYNDPTRQFGGTLDDPNVRLAHYVEVLEQSLESQPEPTAKEVDLAVPCRLC